MLDALRYFWIIYDELWIALGNMFIVSGVSIFWFFIVLFVFNVLIKSLLSLPRSAPRHKFSKK